MHEEQFITRPMSVCLDIVRALAALAVLLGHAVQLGLYTGPYPFSIALQQHAVVVFFVLSGLVIASSASNGKATLAGYALSRAARILPVALPAIAISLGVAALGSWLDVPPIPAAPGNALDGASPAKDALLAAIFLSERFGDGLSANPPYWSLCYEVWFYALFAAATFVKGWQRPAAFAIMLLLAGPNVLLALPAWLAGVWLAHDARARRVTADRGKIYVAACIAAFPLASHLAEPLSGLLVCAAHWNLGHSHYALSDWLLALAVALGFAGLRPLAASASPLLMRLDRPARYLAGISFSIYLVHWPLLSLLRIAGISAGENLAAFAILLLLIVAACAAIASVTEHRRHAVRRALEKALGMKRITGAPKAAA